MPLITSITPATWQELEELATAILSESGMQAQRQVTIALPRGAADIDVVAAETINGIEYRILCECKNWRTNVPREVVHAFRTVMHEAGAHRGYIISRLGFQKGAIEAARATNIELVTFARFQEMYFDKWIAKRIWDIENELGDFNVYYEPLGQPGYAQLQSDAERSAYDAVWNRYFFAGVMLMSYSPYARLVRPVPFPDLPFDVSELERHGIPVPKDVKQATGYREFLALLAEYARTGLRELRGVNPNTRGKADGAFVRELDAPMPPARPNDLP